MFVSRRCQTLGTMTLSAGTARVVVTARDRGLAAHLRRCCLETQRIVMETSMKRLLFALALIVASTTTLAADQKSNGHKNKSQQNDQGQDEGTRRAVSSGGSGVAVSVVFSTGERRVIHEYYAPR